MLSFHKAHIVLFSHQALTLILKYNPNSTRFLALTSGQHQGTLAHAVVIVHVFGAEVCSMDDQTALPACCPAVAL